MAALSATVLASACQSRLVLTYDASSPVGHRTDVLTPDGRDSYRFASSAGAMEARALDSNQGGNLRTVFWPDGAPAVTDSQSCAVWTSQDGAYVQQGAALRIQAGYGRVRALTVTKNVYYGASWIFNFHTWDTTRSIPYEIFGSVELARFRYGNDTVPLPWHFCARVEGSAMEFKVWRYGEREPAWGDRSYGGRATVPSGWSAPGPAGWYIGHLPASGSARFDGLRTWRYGAAPRTAPAPASAESGTGGPGTDVVVSASP
jgi:hypothetical protein